MFLMLFILIMLFAVIIFVYMYYSRESLLSDAIAYYEGGDTPKALDLFKSFATARPNDIRAKWHLAKIYAEEKEYVTALRECIAITVSKYSTFREKAEAYALMARIYIAQGIIEKAVKMALEGFRYDPKNKDVHYQLGRIYMASEKTIHAIKEFNLVLSVDRTNIPSRLKLAEIHYGMRNDVKAIFQYKRILEIEPTNREARFRLASIYYANGEFGTCAEELEKIKNIEGLEIDYYYMLSTYYLKAKNIEKSKELMEKIVLVNEIRDDKLIFMRYELALIYEEEDRLGDAYILYEKIKNDMPRYRDVDSRIHKLKKILYPEEHAEIVNKIDYNSLGSGEFEDLFYNVINRLGFKAAKDIQKNRNKILIVAVEKFRTMLQGKILIQISRSFDAVPNAEVEKFIDRVKDEEAVKGLLITTAIFREDAIKLVEASGVDIDLLDKVNVFEIMGG